MNTQPTTFRVALTGFFQILWWLMLFGTILLCVGDPDLLDAIITKVQTCQ